MKNAPKKIYLQWTDEGTIEGFEDEEFPKSHDGITWCDERIHDSDLEYSRKPNKSKITQIFNAITSNDCREMDEVRFEQAINEIFGETYNE